MHLGKTWRSWLSVTLAPLILPVWTITSQGTPQSSGTRIVMLGTGTPNADPERSGPAVAVVVNDRAYLFDAGPGVVRRASAAQRAGVTALRQPNLDVVFLTHLHSDHTLGLPDLMFSPWVLERTAPLRVYGPPGTFAMVASLLSAYKEDIRVRLDGGEPSNKTGWKSEARDVDPGFVYRDSNVTITAFAVPHGAWTHAFGYRVETRDRVIVISGDTGPSEEVVKQCNGCDVLVHEVRSHEKLATRPPEWQAYHTKFHTSTLELGRLAERAKPKLLVLYHQLYWGATDDDLLREVKSVYSGQVVSARDLGIY